jgi:hypothetical protein
MFAGLPSPNFIPNFSLVGTNSSELLIVDNDIGPNNTTLLGFYLCLQPGAVYMIAIDLLGTPPTYDCPNQVILYAINSMLKPPKSLYMV